MPVLSVVSPVYCEQEGIRPFLDSVESAVRPLGVPFEIILIDDGSTDDSWQCILEESTSRPWLVGLRLSRNFGKEAALSAGLDAAGGKAVITLDSDLQHPPSLIPEMFALWRSGQADIVEAQKENRQRESAVSGFLARMFYALFAWLMPFNLEGASDFKLMDRRVVQAWSQLNERRVFFRGMNKWLGFRRTSILFTPPERLSGTTGWSFAAKLILALDSLSAYSTKLLSFVWVLSLVFAVGALFVGGEALWAKATGKAVTGFTTIILLTLIVGSALLAAICLLTLYLRQIFHEVKARPRYVLSEQIAIRHRPARKPPLPRPAPRRRKPARSRRGFSGRSC